MGWMREWITSAHTSRVTDLAGFVALAIVVIVTPGPDTALTIRNTLVGGRPAGVATAVGVALGQATWSVATSVGIAALLVAAEPAFAALKLAGAAYLIYLGAQSLWTAFRGRPAHPTVDRSVVRVRATRALRQGVLSNLTNPKMAVFFPSLLPQFVTADAPPFLALLALGLLFCLMTLVWLTAYAFAVARAGDVLRRSAIRGTIEAVTGILLVAFGIRLAAPR
jgi:threonine/homoserine/homoserine lactone efflux protein